MKTESFSTHPHAFGWGFLSTKHLCGTCSKSVGTHWIWGGCTSSSVHQGFRFFSLHFKTRSKLLQLLQRMLQSCFAEKIPNVLVNYEPPHDFPPRRENPPPPLFSWLRRCTFDLSSGMCGISYTKLELPTSNMIYKAFVNTSISKCFTTNKHTLIKD